MTLLRQRIGLSTALIIGCLISLTASSTVEAQYSKRVIIQSGQNAPGTDGAVYNQSPWDVPISIAISTAGDVFFMAGLEVGVGDATEENSHGLWVYYRESDSVRLVFRPGDDVPGVTGAVFVSYDAEYTSMDLLGQIGLYATYSVAGVEESAFFMEAGDGSGVLERKVYKGMEVLPDRPGVNVVGLAPRAFNNGRLLFSAAFEGAGIERNRNDGALCMYQTSGVSVIVQRMDPMPMVGNDYIVDHLGSSYGHDPLDRSGGAVVQLRGVKFAEDAIRATFYYSPAQELIPIALSDRDTSKVIFGISRLNSSEWVARLGPDEAIGNNNEVIQAGPIGQASWNTLAGFGDVADGGGGATFGMTRDFVLFDNNQVAMNTGLSDNRQGIWIGDKNGMKKVAVIGDRAPGVDSTMVFTRVNGMMANRVGQVAFTDFPDNGLDGLDGIWVGDTARLEVVSVSYESIEVAPEAFKTIQGHYAGHTWWTSTGADGHSALLNDAGEIAFGVNFEEGGNALLLGSPDKKLKLIDVNDDPLANKQFVLSRVSHDVPKFTETFIDTVMTDSVGTIDISEYYMGRPGGTLMAGDSISLRKVLHTVHSVKHSLLLGSAYRVALDNAQFSVLGCMSYSELDLSAEQEIKVDHTTLEFSLVVSIEWDADVEYIESLEEGFRRMSNYMYDVSDGQMRFDTIAIFDNKDNWGFADVQIYASNMIWPHVDRVGGIYRQSGEASDPVEMPRKWFGGGDSQRYWIFNEFPLDMTASISYRTFAHEFGHFGLSLKDEYRFTDGERLCAARIHAGPYGFMDCQYVNCDEYASELSSEYAYSSASCRNTYHWNLYQQSTWQTVESLFEESYDGIPAPIIRPPERELHPSFDYIPGPNLRYAGTYLMHYDVGALVEFPITHTPPAGRNLIIRFLNQAAPGSESPMIIDAVLVDTTVARNIGDIPQGQSSADGGMRIVGKMPGHVIAAAGYFQEITGASLGLRAGSGRTWLYTGTVNEFPDSIVIGMKAVSGDKAVISRIQLLDRGLNYQLDAPNLFLDAPTIEHQPEGGERTNQTFTSDIGRYSAQIPDSLSALGTFRLTAVDDLGAAFFFNANYTTVTVDSGVIAEVKGPGGVSEATLDNLNNSLQKALMLSTDYLVLRTGLSESALQAGPAQTLAVFPDLPLTGSNSITIRYLDADISVGSGSSGAEESLRIFRWSVTSQQWELVGGGVDTSYNEVTATITNSGVYAAFTTEPVTDVDDDENESGMILPKHFRIHQNFPNPFNPATTFDYDLPISVHVRIVVFNVLGQKVRSLVDREKSAGSHSVTWDGTDVFGKSVASGVYLYRFEAGSFIETKKMLLMK